MQNKIFVFFIYASHKQRTSWIALPLAWAWVAEIERKFEVELLYFDMFFTFVFYVVEIRFVGNSGVPVPVAVSVYKLYR